jgi:hypothetical protein
LTIPEREPEFPPPQPTQTVSAAHVNSAATQKPNLFISLS